MLITGLPEYHDGCYKMEDVVQLLVPFGFQCGDNNIYIVPQIRMVKRNRMITKNKNWNLEMRCVTGFVCFGSQAFVKMPTMESVHNLITKARGEERITLKGAQISFHALGFDNPSSPVSTVLMCDLETDVGNHLKLPSLKETL